MYRVAAILAAAVLAQPVFGQFIEQNNERSLSFEIDDRDGGFTIDLNELNQRSYSFDFHLQVPDLAGVTDDVALQELDIKTRLGEIVHHRVRIDNGEKTFILGSLVEGQKVRVSSFANEDNRPQITFSVTGGNSRGTGELNRDEMVVFDDGREECFDFVRAHKADVDVSVGIAIDISGSMGGYEQLLNQSIQAFSKSVDSNAICSVIEFNHEYDIVVGGNGKHASCRDLRNFKVTKPNGGTTAFPAIQKTYELVQEQSSDIDLVLVVSDGVSDNAGLDAALSRKMGTTTFVNWLGNYNKNYPLAKFADAEIFGAFEQNSSLPDFFDAAGKTISGQFVAKPCGY